MDGARITWRNYGPEFTDWDHVICISFVFTIWDGCVYRLGGWFYMIPNAYRP